MTYILKKNASRSMRLSTTGKPDESHHPGDQTSREFESNHAAWIKETGCTPKALIQKTPEIIIAPDTNSSRLEPVEANLPRVGGED